MYVTNFKAFCILLNALNDTSKGILFYFKNVFFLLTRYKDNSLYEIEFITSY